MFGGVLPLLKIKPFSLVLIVVVTVVRESEIGISITVWISYPDHSAGNPVRARAAKPGEQLTGVKFAWNAS